MKTSLSLKNKPTKHEKTKEILSNEYMNVKLNTCLKDLESSSRRGFINPLMPTLIGNRKTDKGDWNLAQSELILQL